MELVKEIGANQKALRPSYSAFVGHMACIERTARNLHAEGFLRDNEVTIALSKPDEASRAQYIWDILLGTMTNERLDKVQAIFADSGNELLANVIAEQKLTRNQAGSSVNNLPIGSVVSDPAQEHPSNPVTRIHHKIVSDVFAITKWAIIVDRIVRSAADQKRIKALLGNNAYDEAILLTLQIWNSEGSDRADILRVLREYELSHVADSIQKDVMALRSVRRASIERAPVWFDVGEIELSFTGRGTELEQLHKMLQEYHRRDATTVIFISGAGGIGKSSLARMYAFRYASMYDGNVIWSGGETSEAIRVSFLKLANHLCLEVNEKISNQELSKKIYEHFSDRKSLFIFDDIDDNFQWKEFQYQISELKYSVPYILVTSKNDLARIAGHGLKLDVLTEEESVAFINLHVSNCSTVQAAELANKLERLPLALQQAVAYIRDHYLDDDTCIPKYLDEFTRCEQMLKQDRRFDGRHDYSRTTFITWKIMLNKINEMPNGQSAIELMNLLAYLNPDHFSFTFLEGILGRRIEGSVRLLRKYSLITVFEDAVSIHRLVQQVIQLTVQNEAQILGQVVDFIHRIFKTVRSPVLVNECASHGAHLFPLQVKYPELMKYDYLDYLCVYLLSCGNFEECLSTCKQSVEAFELFPGIGVDHESTLRMKWRLAVVHQKMGKHEQAVAVLESILTTAESRYGQSHAITIRTLFLMGQAYFEMGDNGKAVEIFDKVIPQATLLRGENDEELLTYKYYKARALNAIGQTGDALKLLQDVYDNEKKLFGTNNFRISTLEAIGDSAVKRGDLNNALEIYRQVIDGYKSEIEKRGSTAPSASFMK